MARNHRMTRTMKAERARRLYVEGTDLTVIALACGISKETVKRYLKELGTPVVEKKGRRAIICDHCGGLPTPRDRGLLTRIADETCAGSFLWLCSNCLCPEIPAQNVNEKREELEGYRQTRADNLVI